MWYYFTNHLYYLFVLVKKRKALDEVISVLVTGHPEVSIYDNFLFLTNSMERALRPDKFDVLPDTGTSEKDFKFWLKTLENFLAILLQDNLDSSSISSLFNVGWGILAMTFIASCHAATRAHKDPPDLFVHLT